MPNDPVDNPGGATQFGPADEGRTTDVAEQPAAQGVDGGQGGEAPSAEPQGTTEPGVLDVTPAEASKPQPREERETHYQTAYQEQIERQKAWAEVHPEMFGEDGKLLDPSSVKPAAPAQEPGVLDVSGQGQQPQPQPEPAPTATDGQGGEWRHPVLRMLNNELQDAELNASSPLERRQMETQIVNTYLQRYPQLAPHLLPGAAMQPRASGGLTKEEARALAQEVATGVVRTYDQQTVRFGRLVETMRPNLPAGFLEQELRGVQGIEPGLTVEEALPEICAQTGQTSPYIALLTHPQLGPVVRKAELDKAVAVRLAEIAAKGAAEGVPFPGGGGMIAPQAQSASAEITASGHPPRKPSV